jgi:hypothetical protein
MAWTPGHSGNPRGRLPVGLTLADAIRRRFPPERIVDLLEKLTEATDERVRMMATQALADRGYGKVLTEVEITSRQPEAKVDWSTVTPERRRELMAAADEIEAIAETSGADDSVAH